MKRKITSGSPEQGIERRRLLKQTLLGGGALAVGGALSGLAARPASAAVISGVPRKWNLEVDLVSLGSSSGGLVAATIGCDLGLSCAVLEKADLLGGGTSRSNAVIWMPNNHHQRAAGQPDSRELALEHIRSTSFGRHDEEKLAAFLDNGPGLLEYLNARTPLKTVGSLGGDYYTHLPSSRIGRALYPDNEGMDKILKERAQRQPLLNKLRPVAVMVGVMVVGPDDFLGGRALMGGLLAGCLDRNIPVLTNARARRLFVENGRVVGVHVERQGQDFHVRARRGVLIATGGFEWNPEMIKRFAPIPGPICANSAPSNEGDGHTMGMEVGAAVALMDCGVWIPTLHTPGERNWGMAQTLEVALPASGITFNFPGEIVVNRHGKRCCDESFYPAPPRALSAEPANKESEFANQPMFCIVDQKFRDQFDLGPLPKGTEMRPWVTRAGTLRELAGQLGINPDNLEETVKRYNGFAKDGIDRDFGRGQDRSNEIRRAEIARAKQANPNARAYTGAGELGTLEKPPFYAAQVGIGSVGTRGGLVTNAQGQVISVRGEVIPGLYATSNSAAQLAVGGGYASGQSHAQSMVFGYLAAKHMAGTDARGRA